MADELKPCPFCGSESKFIGDSISIKCPNCGCAFIATNPLLSRMDVAGYWNKREQQAVDAVPVVRCKDCKFYTESKNRCDHPCMDYDVECYDQWLEVNHDDFCSYGERRTDHETDKSG